MSQTARWNRLLQSSLADLPKVARPMPANGPEFIRAAEHLADLPPETCARLEREWNEL